MRDIIKRFLIIVVYGALLSYVIYLFSTSATIVTGEYLQFNNFILILLIIFSLYKFVFYGVYPIRVKFSKISLFVLGVVLLFVGEYILINDPSKWIYIGDMMKIVAVILIVLSPTNALHTDKVMKKEKEKGIEIIEI